jgi:hypothetical protein
VKWLLVLALAGCAEVGPAAHRNVTDAGIGSAGGDGNGNGNGNGSDGGNLSDGGVTDGNVHDLASVNDLSTSGSSDLSSSNNPDLSTKPDLSSVVSGPPCLNGPGFAAFRFHYDTSGSQSPIVDAFGLPDSSNWEATPVYSTSIVDPGNGGGLEIGSGNWILIRYSLVGLHQINGARFSVFGRSYDTTASASFDAWSPIYGDAPSPTDSVSNAWPYAWTTVDYTGHLAIGDDPGLTGIRLYSGPSSNTLVIHAVELCIDGN